MKPDFDSIFIRHPDMSGEGEFAMARQPYNTRQRELVRSLMDAHRNAYFTVDDVCAQLRRQGEAVGRTTVYRTLERLVADGLMTKVADIRGGAAQYRSVPAQAAEATDTAHGQLRCERCGRVFPLDCDMLGAFAEHVGHEHGFVIDERRTVLYGLCADCRAKDAGDSRDAGDRAVPESREADRRG